MITYAGIHLPSPSPRLPQSRLRETPSKLSHSVVALSLVCAVSCSALPGLGDEPDGYAIVVYLNRSSHLVQGILALGYPDEPPIVWVNAIAPKSWEPLVFDCGFTQVAFVSAIPVDLATGQEGKRVAHEGEPLRTGEQVTCGSLVVVDISNPPTAQPEPALSLAVRTIPEALPKGLSDRPVSALSPGTASGLVLLRHSGLTGVPMRINSTWATPSGRIFVGRVDLAGAGPGTASLLECPVEQVGWGDLRNPAVPGAVLTETGQAIPAPAPITSDSGLTCGAVVTLRALGSPEAISDIRLETNLSTAKSTVHEGVLDVFGNLRRLLDEEGFAGRLSSNLALLPAPGVAGSTPVRPTEAPLSPP